MGNNKDGPFSVGQGCGMWATLSNMGNNKDRPSSVGQVCGMWAILSDKDK
jgi:hypothetical protein